MPQIKMDNSSIATQIIAETTKSSEINHVLNNQHLYTKFTLQSEMMNMSSLQLAEFAISPEDVYVLYFSSNKGIDIRNTTSFFPIGKKKDDDENHHYYKVIGQQKEKKYYFYIRVKFSQRNATTFVNGFIFFAKNMQTFFNTVSLDNISSIDEIIQQSNMSLPTIDLNFPLIKNYFADLNIHDSLNANPGLSGAFELYLSQIEEKKLTNTWNKFKTLLHEYLIPHFYAASQISLVFTYSDLSRQTFINIIRQIIKILDKIFLIPIDFLQATFTYCDIKNKEYLEKCSPEEKQFVLLLHEFLDVFILTRQINTYDSYRLLCCKQ